LALYPVELDWRCEEVDAYRACNRRDVGGETGGGEVVKYDGSVDDIVCMKCEFEGAS
jgi:hypothetical protein